MNVNIFVIIPRIIRVYKANTSLLKTRNIACLEKKKTAYNP